MPKKRLSLAVVGARSSPDRDGMGHEELFTMKRAKERDERGCRGPLDFDLTSAERANEPDSVGLRVSSVSQ